MRKREKSGVTWRIELSLTEMGNPRGVSVSERKHLGGEFGLGHVKCEMYVTCSRDSVKQAAASTSLEFREVVRALIIGI